MKARIILKSLAELPANALDLAASIPGRAASATRQALAPTARATRRQIRTARQHSMRLLMDIYARANTPFRNVQPWTRGGLNE